MTSASLTILAAVTWKPILQSIAFFAVGTLLLLFCERIQVRLLKWHDDLRDAPNTSQFMLRLSGQNFEAPMRIIGSVLILAGLILLLLTVIRDHSPS